jgi:predicted polyphosphate/ATP-dependent NAD kinase
LGGQIQSSEEDEKKDSVVISSPEVSDVDERLRKRRFLRKMRFQECHTLRLRHIACH